MAFDLTSYLKSSDREKTKLKDDEPKNGAFDLTSYLKDKSDEEEEEELAPARKKTLFEKIVPESIQPYAKAALQVPIGGAEMSTIGLALSAIDLLTPEKPTFGEEEDPTPSMERIGELKKKFPAAPWENLEEADVDLEKAEEAYSAAEESARKAKEYIPTVSKLAAKVGLEAETGPEKFLRLSGSGGKIAKGGITEKALKGASAATASKGLQELGVPEALSDFIGLGMMSFLKKSIPTTKAEITAAKAVKEAKVTKAPIQRASGLIEREIFEADPEVLAKKQITPARAEETLRGVSEETKALVRSVKEKAIPLSKVENEADSLLDLATKTYKGLERGIKKDPNLLIDTVNSRPITKAIDQYSKQLVKERPVLGTDRRKTLDFIKKYKKQFLKEIEVEKPIERPPVIEQIFGKKTMKEQIKSPIKLNLQSGINILRENNKEISKEYRKLASGETNMDKIGFLLDVNTTVSDQLASAYPSHHALLKEGDTFYKAFKDLSTFENMMGSILGEKPSATAFRNIFRSEGKVKQLEKIVGKKNAKDLKNIAIDFEKVSHKLNKIPKKKLFGIMDIGLGIFSPKVAGAKKLVDLRSYFWQKGITKPKYQAEMKNLNFYLKKVSDSDIEENIPKIVKILNRIGSDVERDYKKDKEREKEIFG